MTAIQSSAHSSQASPAQPLTKESVRRNGIALGGKKDFYVIVVDTFTGELVNLQDTMHTPRQINKIKQAAVPIIQKAPQVKGDPLQRIDRRGFYCKNGHSTNSGPSQGDWQKLSTAVMALRSKMLIVSGSSLPSKGSAPMPQSSSPKTLSYPNTGTSTSKPADASKPPKSRHRSQSVDFNIDHEEFAPLTPASPKGSDEEEQDESLDSDVSSPPGPSKLSRTTTYNRLPPVLSEDEANNGENVEEVMGSIPDYSYRIGSSHPRAKKNYASKESDDPSAKPGKTFRRRRPSQRHRPKTSGSGLPSSRHSRSSSSQIKESSNSNTQYQGYLSGQDSDLD